MSKANRLIAWIALTALSLGLVFTLGWIHFNLADNLAKLKAENRLDYRNLLEHPALAFFCDFDFGRRRPGWLSSAGFRQVEIPLLVLGSFLIPVGAWTSFMSRFADEKWEGAR